MKKTIIVAGAMGTLGFELINVLAQHDYNIVGLDVVKDQIKLDHLNKKKNFYFFKTDISSLKQLKKIISKCKKKFKKIHIAVNCAYPLYKKTNLLSKKINQNQIEYNLTKHLGGAIFFSTQMCELFAKYKSGNLINISSIQGVRPPKFHHYKNQNFYSPIEYSAIKSGIISITKYLSKFYLKQGLRVNCISPGGIKNKKHNGLFIKNYLKDCGKIGLLRPENVISTILFLISDNSKAINGQNLVIDDGWSL